MKKLSLKFLVTPLVALSTAGWACSSSYGADVGREGAVPAVATVQPGNFVEIGGAPGPVSFTSSGTVADVDAFQRDGQTVIVVPIWAVSGDATVSRANTNVRSLKIVAAPVTAAPGTAFLAYLDTVATAAESPAAPGDEVPHARATADLKQLLDEIRTVVRRAQSSSQQIGLESGQPVQLGSSDLVVLDGVANAVNLPVVTLHDTSGLKTQDWGTDKAGLIAAAWTIVGVAETVVGGAIFVAPGGALPGVALGSSDALIAASSASVFANIVDSPDFTPKEDARDATRMFYEAVKARSALAANILDDLLFPDAGAAEREADKQDEDAGSCVAKDDPSGGPLCQGLQGKTCCVPHAKDDCYKGDFSDNRPRNSQGLCICEHPDDAGGVEAKTPTGTWACHLQ